MILPEKDGRGDDKWRCRWESEGMWESSAVWKEKWKKERKEQMSGRPRDKVAVDMCGGN